MSITLFKHLCFFITYIRITKKLCITVKIAAVKHHLKKTNKTYKIGSFNVRGLRDPKKRRQIFTFIKERNFDIMFLQETHALTTDEIFWRSQWSGEMYFSNGTHQSKGVAILVKKGAQIEIIKHQTDKMGRIVIIDTKTDSGEIRFINVYAPNEDSPQILQINRESNK